MPTGIRIRGVNTFDRLPRILGEVNTGTGSGSINVPGFSEGTPDYMERHTDSNNFGVARSIGISGNTLSWDAGNGTPSIIVYWVY